MDAQTTTPNHATSYSPLAAMRVGSTPRRTQRIPVEGESALSVDAVKKRKRERDKLSQQRKRQRDREYIEVLEAKIRQLESLLARRETSDAFALASHHPTTTSLSTYHLDVDLANDQYTRTSSSHRSSIISANPRSACINPAELITLTPLTECNQVSGQQPVPSGVAGSDNIALNPSYIVSASLGALQGLLAAPRWLRLPIHGLSLNSDAQRCVRGSNLSVFISKIRDDTAQKSHCPAHPQVIDILFGGSTNPLANTIATACSREAISPPEKFAVSWALYMYLRWLIWPSEETFALLPNYFHPTALQLTVEHPWCIDLVPWPAIRENMIMHQSTHDIDAAIGLFLCSYRIRGAFNGSFITRQNGGDLEIDAQFYEQFMAPDKWGLLETFWVQYPDLVQGLDPKLLIRQEDLLTMTLA